MSLTGGKKTKGRSASPRQAPAKTKTVPTVVVRGVSPAKGKWKA